MAIKLTNTKEAVKHVKCLVYGESGVGKTVLCSTAPNPVIISAEKGLLSLKHVDIPVIEITTPDDFTEAYEFIAGSKGKKFETVCLDSISDIAESTLDYYKKNPEDGNSHPQAAYGSMATKILPLIKQFIHLPNHNVYFTAKAKRMKDDHTGITSWMPSMPGQQLGPALPYLFDFVFRMQVGEKEVEKKVKEYRYLQTHTDISSICKDRSGELNPIEKPDLSHIFSKALNIKTKKEK